MKKKPLFVRILKLLGKVILICFLVSIAFTILYRFVNPPITPLMVLRLGQQVFDENRDVRLKKDWVSLAEISPNLICAVVSSEDNLFLNHNGFDIKQLKLALDEREKGKRVRGGSTISMQTAKNVFLVPSRNFIRKGFEAYFTVLIELFWSKERIMEVYLNVIEFGDGIYGANSAANYYFHKSALRLSKREAALLAACLPSPLKRNPAKPSSYITRRAAKIESLMSLVGPINFDKKASKANIKKKKK